MNNEMVNFSVDLLSQNLQFMALFIAVYESFEDYIHERPKNFLDGSLCINNSASDYKQCCKDEEKRQKGEKESAKRHLSVAEKNGDAISEESDVYIYANYDYRKISDEGFTKWLSPKYDAYINNKILTINGKKQSKPNVLLNSLIFLSNLTEADIPVFLGIKNLRNEFAHNMSDLLITKVITDENKVLFDKLIAMYKKANNYWSVGFECGIADDVPENADYENINSVKMFNLLASIDALLKTRYLNIKKYQHFMGLYDNLIIPIKMEEQNNVK